MGKSNEFIRMMKMEQSEIDKRTAWAKELNERYADLGFGSTRYYLGPGSELEEAEELIVALEGLGDDQIDVYKALTSNRISPEPVTLFNPSTDEVREFRLDIVAGLQYREVDDKKPYGKWQQTMVNGNLKLIDWLEQSKVELID